MHSGIHGNKELRKVKSLSFYPKNRQVFSLLFFFLHYSGEDRIYLLTLLFILNSCLSQMKPLP